MGQEGENGNGWDRKERRGMDEGGKGWDRKVRRGMDGTGSGKQ